MNIINRRITDNYILAALIGVLSVFPAIIPTIMDLNRNKTFDTYRNANLEGKIIWMPIFCGIMNIIIFHLVDNYFPRSLRKYWMIGIIIGLIYPTIGRIGNSSKKEYNYRQLYTTSQLFYVPFYGIAIAAMVYYLRCD